MPWLRGEGDINISISFTNGIVKIDRRTYLLDNGYLNGEEAIVQTVKPVI